MKRYRLLNLGAGVQSGAIYQLMVDGEIESADYAIFSDTQEEPKWVYEQLNYLKTQGGPKIIEVTDGKIGDHLKNGMNARGQRFASIPSHTTYQEGVKGGLTRRQCTSDYKIVPIERWIRRELLGLKKGQRIPKDVRLTSLFGFSTDESRRAIKMQSQFAGKANWNAEFPLFDDEIMMTRYDAKKYIEERSGFEWRSSRCVFCPLQSNRHWLEIKMHDPVGFERAVDVDNTLRDPDAVVNRGMNENMYVHKSCRPLGEANLDEQQQTLEFGCDNGCFT